MEFVACFERFFLVGDADVLAFVRVELHLPCVFPLLEAIEIALEEFFISSCFDVSAHHAVVSEQACG